MSQPINGYTIFDSLDGNSNLVPPGDSELTWFDRLGWDFSMQLDGAASDSQGFYVQNYGEGTPETVNATSDGNVNIDSESVAANNGTYFSLNAITAVDAGYDNSGGGGVIQLFGFRNGVLVASMSQNVPDISNGGPAVQFDTSGIPGFQDINSFEVLPADGNYVNEAIGIGEINATNFHPPGPFLTPDIGDAAFVEADNTPSTPVAVSPGLTVGDDFGNPLATVTIAITGNYQSAEDVLAFTNDSSTEGNITGSFSNGTLTLTSAGNSATLAQWQAAVDAVTYTNIAVTPDVATRTVTFAATDAGDNVAAPVTRDITLQATDQSPIVHTANDTLNYVLNTDPILIDTNQIVSDADNTTLATASITITDGFHGGDTLAFNPNPGTGDITANLAGNILSLTSSSGNATVLEWQHALDAITFSSTSGVTGARTISFSVNDGTKDSTPATDSITILAGPVLTADSGSASFVEADNTPSTPVVVSPGLTLTDDAAGTLTSATVSITGNYNASEDLLAFTNDGSEGDITGSYDAQNGILTLTSVTGADLAEWQAALEAVTYTDTAASPNTATRTITFAATDASQDIAAPVSRDVTVQATDQTPIITTSHPSVTYVRNAPPVVIDPGQTVTDANNPTLTRAYVSFTDSYDLNRDLLSFTNNGETEGNIVGSYNSDVGVLVLSSSGSTATLAEWQNALDAVTFSTSSTMTGTRTVQVVLYDGTNFSAPAADNITVLAGPVLTADGGTASFVEADNIASTPIAVSPGLTLTDDAGGTLTSATVAITGNYFSSQDILAFTNDGSTEGNIAGSYSNGILTLTSDGGTATLAEWQAALDAVTYTNVAVTPNTATRTVSFNATDSAGNAATVATRDISVQATDQSPIVTTSHPELSYVRNAAPIVIDAAQIITDADNTTLASATVTISSGYNNGDTLGFINDGSTEGNITGSFSDNVLTLTSSGSTATLAEWQAALDAVTFSSGNGVPGTRTISVVVNDGTNNSAAATDTIVVEFGPLVSAPPSGPAFIEPDNAPPTPVAISPSLFLSDDAAATLQSATVRISAGYHPGSDVLAFTNDGSTEGNITGQFDSESGTLTLSSAGNTATIGNWQAALQAVTYADNALTSSIDERGFTFAVTDTGGNLASDSGLSINIIPTDQTPIVITFQPNASVTRNTAPIVIDAAQIVTDTDSTTLASATVTISGGYNPGDTLGFINDDITEGNITGSFSGNMLTLTSSDNSATLAEWQAALDAVTFSSISTVPGPRTITIAVNDGSKTSAPATDTVTLLQGPVLTLDTGFANFVEADNTASTPVAVSPGLTLTDDAGTLASATVSIIGDFQPGEDVLGFTNDGSTEGNITGSYDGPNGTLTLTSAGNTATVANWQAALAAVTYTDTAATPDTDIRTVSFTAVDTAGNHVSSSIRDITLQATDQTPIVTTASRLIDIFSNDTAYVVDPAITVSDRDNSTLASASVTIGDAQSGDALSFSNTSADTFGNIAGSFSDGTLTLTSEDSTATLAQWQAALAAVTFSSTSTVTGTRTISFTASDGTKTSAPATDLIFAVGATPSGGGNLTVTDTQVSITSQITSASPVILASSGASPAVLNVSPGALLVAPSLTLGAANQSSSTLNVSGSVGITGNANIGSNATLKVAPGGNLQAGSITVYTGGTLQTFGSIATPTITDNGGALSLAVTPNNLIIHLGAPALAPNAAGAATHANTVTLGTITGTTTVDGFTFGDSIDLTGAALPSGLISQVTVGAGTLQLATADGVNAYAYSDGNGGTLITAASTTEGIYRFFDTTNGTHFFTGSATEAQTVQQTRPDLVYEGNNSLAEITPGNGDPNAAPVYRFFSTADGTHFYTDSTSERDAVMASRPDLVYEPGATFYEHATAQPGDVAVYRFFDSSNGTHFYTDSASEVASIQSTRPNMVAEGIAFYEPPHAT